MNKSGKVLGISNRYYLLDGVWMRCACGCSILEILKVRWCGTEDVMYQIRSFNNNIPKRHRKNSCIEMDAVGLETLFDILTCSDVVCRCVDKETKYCLKAKVDNDGDLSISLYTPNEKKEVWGFLLDGNEIGILRNELKRLLGLNKNCREKLT